ncbi:MAG: RagB/SusD family nutrient uptake outer membrane protein, partial [Bacteroidales bacterium]|nr:RagB/SusD family nutrient uptake outer membrane protein [Bacteroidales bacterium]
NANNALKYIEINKNLIDNINYQIIKGELLTIRAFLHFDLMRLYGLGNLAIRGELSSKYAIPYVTTLNKEMTPQLTYKQTIDLIVADLKSAITLLEIDPVTKINPDSFYSEVNIDGFFANRQHRFNYYAANLLLARVYMWEGSTASIEEALTLANKVIAGAESNSLVKWATSTSVTEDVAMKSEHLVSLNTQNLTSRTADYFRLVIIANDNIFAQYISNNRMMSVYETESVGSTDFRFSKLFIPNSVILDGNNAYTPLKFFGTTNEKMTKNYIPLMRIPEAYYIASECYLKKSSPDAAAALNLLNSVRNKRGITSNLTNTNPADIMNEIVKEYAKEFYCEGAMFFLYKRLGMESIPEYNKPANDDIYVLPYPDAELQMGRKQ